MKFKIKYEGKSKNLIRAHICALQIKPPRGKPGMNGQRIVGIYCHWPPQWRPLFLSRIETYSLNLYYQTQNRGNIQWVAHLPFSFLQVALWQVATMFWRCILKVFLNGLVLFGIIASVVFMKWSTFYNQDLSTQVNAIKIWNKQEIESETSLLEINFPWEKHVYQQHN